MGSELGCGDGRLTRQDVDDGRGSGGAVVDALGFGFVVLVVDFGFVS